MAIKIISTITDITIAVIHLLLKLGVLYLHAPTIPIIKPTIYTIIAIVCNVVPTQFLALFAVAYCFPKQKKL